jgi:hypothetical protein
MLIERNVTWFEKMLIERNVTWLEKMLIERNVAWLERNVTGLERITAIQIW